MSQTSGLQEIASLRSAQKQSPLTVFLGGGLERRVIPPKYQFSRWKIVIITFLTDESGIFKGLDMRLHDYPASRVSFDLL